MGPKADDASSIKKLIKAGMSVARLNFSHADHEEHLGRIRHLKALREELQLPLAILLDSKGPEVRVGLFADKKVTIKKGDLFTLTADDVPGDATKVSTTYPDLYKYVKSGDSIMLNDGYLEIAVKEVKGKDVVCTVVHGGELSNNKSVNLPDTEIDMPYMSEKDANDFLFGIKEDVDFIALSFVRTADDVKLVKEFLSKNGGDHIQLIAKIENQQGVNNLASILDLVDGAMVARGDMGVEIAFDKLPAIQKEMIKMCNDRGKTVITATQMLESMIDSPRPTRAETTDVANAIYDGSSATMLSGETAMGKFNVDAVKTMAKIAHTAESNINYAKRFKANHAEINSITDAVSHSAVMASFDLKAKAIIAITKSGYTARKISRFRPACPIISVTPSKKVFQQLALSWGVVPVMAEEKSNSDELFEYAISRAKEEGLVKSGDLVVIAAGVPIGVQGTTNTLRVEFIK